MYRFFLFAVPEIALEFPIQQKQAVNVPYELQQKKTKI